jgi:hypothetical protein
MQDRTITYGQLANKLHAYGYDQQRGEYNNKQARLFKHPTLREARILLPDAPDEALVEGPFLKMVLVILKTHGLLEEKNPLLTG